MTERELIISAGDGKKVELQGNLSVPESARGAVLFVHGSGSSRHSPRNRQVAAALNRAGLATLLFDLLTAEEETVDRRTAHLRFDIQLLARRLGDALDWASRDPDLQGLRLGCFGSSTGAGAALVAASERPEQAASVVSRGGRPDLAGPALPSVRAPTLLIVGSRDEPVIEMNRDAMAQMTCAMELELVEGATHLFEEPGTLERVSDLAADWFLRTLAQRT